MDLNVIFLFAPPQGGDAGGGMLPTVITFLAIGLIFYFMIIRPQSKRMKEHKKLVESVKRGDRVKLNGGMRGKVTDVREATLMIEIARGTIVEFDRGAVQSVLNEDKVEE